MFLYSFMKSICLLAAIGEETYFINYDMIYQIYQVVEINEFLGFYTHSKSILASAMSVLLSICI